MAIICLSYIGATLYRILFFAVVGSRCVCRILPDLSCLDKRRMWNQDCLPKLSPRHPAALQMVSMVTFSTQASAAGSLLSFLSHFPSLSKSARQGAKISISLGWESIMAFTVETSWQWRHFPRYENASPFWGGFSSLQTGVRFWLKGTFPIDVSQTTINGTYRPTCSFTHRSAKMGINESMASGVNCASRPNRCREILKIAIESILMWVANGVCVCVCTWYNICIYTCVYIYIYIRYY